MMTNMQHVLSTFLLVAFSQSYSYYEELSEITLERIMGILILVFSVLGIVVTKMNTKESVTYLLQNNSEQTVSTLRKEHFSHILLQSKEMVSDDKVATGGVFLNGNVKRLCIATSNRLLGSSLVNNVILNLLFVSILYAAIFPEWFLVRIILVSIKVVAAFFAYFVSVEFERRWVVFSSALLGSLIAFVLGFIFEFSDNPTNALAITLICIFQFVVSAGVETMQHVVLGEAFSSRQQPWSVAFVTIVDYIVCFSIIIISYLVVVINFDVYFFKFGGIIAVLAFSQLALPNTKNLTFKDTANAFTNAHI